MHKVEVPAVDLCPPEPYVITVGDLCKHQLDNLILYNLGKGVQTTGNRIRAVYQMRLETGIPCERDQRREQQQVAASCTSSPVAAPQSQCIPWKL